MKLMKKLYDQDSFTLDIDDIKKLKSSSLFDPQTGDEDEPKVGDEDKPKGKLERKVTKGDLEQDDIDEKYMSVFVDPTGKIYFADSDVISDRPSNTDDYIESITINKVGNKEVYTFTALDDSEVDIARSEAKDLFNALGENKPYEVDEYEYLVPTPIVTGKLSI